MARDALEAVSREMGRLLSVGGGNAGHDEVLAGHARAVRLVAGQVAAVAPLADALELSTRGSARQAAEALLTASHLASRVEAARAKASEVRGELAPMAAAPAIETRGAHEQVASLAASLSKRDGGAASMLARPELDLDVVLDLRLLWRWLLALDDRRCGELIATRVLPLLGEHGPSLLLQVIDLGGDERHGAALEALARLAPASAAALVEQAIERGSPALRASALRVLKGSEPARAQALARALARSAHVPVRLVCVEVLSGDESDEALTLLVEACEEAGALGQKALGALSRSVHRDAPMRMAALVQRALGSVSRVGWTAAHSERAMTVLRGLEGPLPGPTIEALLTARASHHDHGVKMAAHDALIRCGDEAALEQVAASLSPTAPYGELLSALVGIAREGEVRAGKALIKLLERVDRSDRYHIYYAIRDSHDEAGAARLVERARQKKLDETERSLLRALLQR